MLSKKRTSIGFFNRVLIVAILALWTSVFWFQGLAGAVSWTLIKLVLPFAGVAIMLGFGIAATIMRVKKKEMLKPSVTFVMGGILAFPVLITLNVVPLAYPASLTNAAPSAVIISPLKEIAVIGWGGDRLEDNLPHAMWASERWAYDIVMEPFDHGSEKLEDYGIWDKEVFSPAEGTVVAAYDREEDIPPNTENFLSTEGNYVYIRLEETGTYLLLNHLKQDSVAVEAGDEVRIGDYLGRVGNSGSTSEPHLHIHHQRQNPSKTLFPVAAEGLPLYFSSGTEAVLPGMAGSFMPVKGESLRP